MADGIDQGLHAKLNNVLRLLSSYGKTAVALSGGVDSTLLLKLAVEALGSGNVIAVTACADGADSINPEAEDAAKNAGTMGVRHIVFHSGEYENEQFLQNTRERCYICKKQIFGGIVRIAAEYEITKVIEGTNQDDREDFRPGQIALEELGIISPLRDGVLGKDDIRKLAKQYKLDVWNRPSNACLATRFPYGTRIDPKIIPKIGEAERFLREYGFRQVRVRYHGAVARIELDPLEMLRIFENGIAKEVYEHFRALGFDYTALDLLGYRTGSLNER